MASPTHRDNVVNPKYSEIGVAVVPGNLQGQDTVLVVQLFGTQTGGAVPESSPNNSTSKAELAKTPVTAQVKGQEIASMVPPEVNVIQTTPASSPVAVVPPRYNQFNLSRFLNLGTTLLFILALILDLYLAESKMLTRRVGNNWAHILFINLILLATTIVNAGRIM
jgi:hypothetical protein